VRTSPVVRKLAFLTCAAAFALSARAQTSITVDATKPVRVVDDRMFGVNTAVWDSAFTDAQTLTTLQTVDARFLRYPGGSSADDFHWQTNTAALEGGNAGSTDFDSFAAYALAIGAQVIITVNYGTGTPAEAAAWVAYSKSKGYGFKYWEVGNECYGTWEDDNNTPAHSGLEYATRAVQYIQAMKAADPTIKVGVVADSSEDSYADGNTTPVTNPVTNATHLGFTPVMLSTMKSLGTTMPDFIIYHNYAQNAGGENDANLLQFAPTWTSIAASLRAELNDYLGSAGAGIEILCTENNSVSSGPGKQTTSLVNGLYYADSLGSLMQTEVNSLVWWALHNGRTAGNNSSSLYGWRMYGDYGIEGGDNDQPVHDPYPVYYVQKLLTHFARGGDTVVTASSGNTLLTPYAVKRQDGSLSLLVINKSPTATATANFTLSGFTPQANATVYSYGIPQDDNSEENASVAAAPPAGFSWENDYDGWVNQSGQPDDTTTNYGLDAPFLYSLGFSTTTGVTKGTYSLACTTTASNPGDSAVIQNSSASIGTALSTAASVSLDVYPVITGASSVDVSVYINGKNLPYVVLGTVTVTANQENTSVTFPINDQQRAGIAASLGTGNWFQVGININAPAPITAYFDNFIITPTAGSAPTPTPVMIAGAASSPDIAVSTISNAGPTFSASFGPYSATVISLQGPTSAPVATSQPTSQSIASGHTVVFSFPASGSPTPAYQWSLNGVAIPSATSANLIINNATAADAGTYTCTATNASGSVTSSPATLNVVSTANPGRLVNLSARALVGTGGNIIFGGFATGGPGTSGKQPVLIRASGPAIAGAPFNVPGTLPDPQLQLFDQNGVAIPGDENEGWGASAQITATADAVGAFSWGTQPSHDAALDLSLAAGPYTAQVSGQSGDTGVSIVEVYDATPAGTYTPASPRLTNLSARVDVGKGAANALFAGFVISGDTAVTVLIRASGPAIAPPPFNVPGTLPDPQLSLEYQSNGNVIASNSAWGGDPQISSTAASVGAFRWSDATSHDSAILVTLPPGNYNAVVSGESGDAGVAIVEVYEVP
jgi:hypothetical protein